MSYEDDPVDPGADAYLYFVPRVERQPLRDADALDAMLVRRPHERRGLRVIYRRLRSDGVRADVARSIIVTCLYIGQSAQRIEMACVTQVR